MATATTTVTITVGNAFAQVTESTGDVPWTEVQEACSFSDSLLAKKLYPEKPIICVYMGGKFSRRGRIMLEQNNIPDYNDLKKAAISMKALIERGVLLS